MISITAAAISTLAVTVFAYRSVGAMSAGRDPHRNVVLSEELEDRVLMADAVPGATEDPAMPKPMTLGSCTDSDGGDNPNVPGYVTLFGGGPVQDTCMTAGQLWEEVCNGSVNQAIVHNCNCVWVSIPTDPIHGNRTTGKCQ